MKSVFGLSLLAASASAFAPQQQRASAQSALKAFEGEIGATPINGEMVCWDPLGFCTDQASFDKFRSLELKHGRVASTFCFSVSLHRIDWWRWIVYLDLVRTSHLTQLPASPFLYLKCLPFWDTPVPGKPLTVSLAVPISPVATRLSWKSLPLICWLLFSPFAVSWN